MAQTVIGMFDSSADAQKAVQDLIDKGFSRDNIDVTNSGSSSTSSANAEDHEESGITRFFKNLFSDDDDNSGKYSTVAKRSGSIVTVHATTSDQAEDAADILDDAGAVNVDERAASYGYTGSGSADRTLGSTDDGFTNSGSDAVNSAGFGTAYVGASDISRAATSGVTGADDLTTGDTRSIPVIEENLQVGKREVLTGGVRLRSRIVERPVEESLRLREENVRVERTAVDRAATAADLANFEGTEIEMTERAEVPVVAKEARVVEEVSIGKDVSERTQTISDTVRKTEVDVENIEGTDTSTNTTTTDSRGF